MSRRRRQVQELSMIRRQHKYKKTGLQQRQSWQPTPTSLEELNGAMLIALRPATFKKMIKILLGYAILNYRLCGPGRPNPLTLKKSTMVVVVT